ncbi:MAG TPA: hypothetical protein VK467_08770, partial [Gemmatimonadales bacterium]|nr:hypothetical protein [Gemmatimonadales bacterium]
LVVALVLLSVAAFAVDTETPFDLNSTGSMYPFVARLQGAISERHDSLIIEVRGGVVGSQIPSELGDEGAGTNVSIAFGLGRQDPDGWNFEHETEAQQVAEVLRTGQTAKVGTLRFVIPGVDTVPLAERWLVAQVGVQQHLPGIQAGLLTSYACVEENLRGPTPTSRVRATGMKKQYSTIC